MDDMKTLLSFGIEHPARTMDFADLKKGLLVEVDKGNINVTYHPNFPQLAIFKYSIDCVAERNWNKFTLMARGLILDLEVGVVATPFVKFFNYGEIESGSFSVIESEFTVAEKIDGSLGIMFFYADEWRVATAGSFASEQALWAMDWMKENMSLDMLVKGNTYLFEIVYPENKIVVQYDFSGLVLLGVIEGSSGLEYAAEQLDQEASLLGTRCVKLYDFDDMDSILKNAETLGLDEEGYVIRFKSGIRLKIKGDEYVRIHKLISRVTPLAIWESMLNGDDLDELKREMPEEMEKDIETMITILEKSLSAFVEEVRTFYFATVDMTDKELGLYMSNNPEAFAGREFKTSKSYIFLMRSGRFYDELNNMDPKKLTRRKIFNAFKPKANFLKGYTPSSVVTRFSNNV